MKVLGIDPGLDGALAMFGGAEGAAPKLLNIYQVPAVKSTGRGREIQWSVLNHDWDEKFFWTDHVYLERVMSRHGEGVASAFKFGLVYGGVRGMIAAKLLPVSLVTPGVWKRHYGIQASKSGAVLKAEQLFPEHAPQFRGPRGGLRDGLAEAALIARYGYYQLVNGE